MQFVLRAVSSSVQDHQNGCIGEHVIGSHFCLRTIPTLQVRSFISVGFHHSQVTCLESGGRAPQFEKHWVRDVDYSADGPDFESRRRHGPFKCTVPLRHGNTLNSRQATSPFVRLVEGYTRTFGDGPCNLEPCSSDEDDTSARTPSPNYHTTPTEERLSSRQM
ncbi:hypothetical protein TNCV_2685391 [Trichonephila clavipes]|nr:hypothetical protein TNCV_2685391 [Trichonephila clavipes]